MQNTATITSNASHHYTILKVVDGDGFLVINSRGVEEEVRLYGIDAPELKKCSKLLQDEKETHLPGQLLMELGRLSLHFLLELCPPGTPCTLVQEPNNTTDPYGRKLAYAYLPNGSCINEKIVRAGYAKPYSKVFCQQLPYYQELHLEARAAQKGLFQWVSSF